MKNLGIGRFRPLVCLKVHWDAFSLSPFVHTHSRPNNQMATNDLHKSSAGCAPCRGRGERGGLKHAAVAAEPTNSIRFTTGITDLFLAPSLLVKLTLTRSTHVGERL